MDKLKLEKLLELDKRTRILSRCKDGRKVKLGVSACLCLEALIIAGGEVLSQEALLDFGWRQVGIEVTPSSLRVTINQIRRALLSLQVDKDILIVTVPRAGYRLVSYSGSDSEKTGSEVELKEDNLNEETLNTKHLIKTNDRHWISRYGLLLLGSSLAGGGLIAWLVSMWVSSLITVVNYIPYDNPRLVKPVNAQIFVDESRPASEQHIVKVLKLWAEYAADANDYPYLYINDGHNVDYAGLFACKKALGEDNNGCSSSVFRTH